MSTAATVAESLSLRALRCENYPDTVVLLDGAELPVVYEELRSGERDVAALAKATELSHSSVSQHLMVLRAHRVVTERREGRRVIYRLRSEELAQWLVQGMSFLATMDQQTDEVRKAIRKARSKWSE